MKHTTLVVALLLATALSLSAGPLTSGKATKINNILVEKNLLMGANSENSGLKISSIYRLGEYKSDKAVIPLLGILNNNSDENLRIVAALSLYKIGDARGLFAIKQAARFDDSDRVRRICSNFYNEYLTNQN